MHNSAGAGKSRREGLKGNELGTHRSISLPQRPRTADNSIRPRARRESPTSRGEIHAGRGPTPTSMMPRGASKALPVARFECGAGPAETRLPGFGGDQP